jgi:ectoine hydroxylase-related dioxygenase (phytanoyl-CoA dioxygenase family)
MSYQEDGYVIVPGLIPDRLLDAYCEAWWSSVPDVQGWPDCTPYVDRPAVRDLCLCAPICDAVEHLVGEPPLLHLNLSGWVSTERAWHQDTYLNPPEVGDHYCAAWIALEDIHPDAGPFEYIPGSHRWPVLSREMVFATLTPEEQADPGWPRTTEGWVGEHWEGVIEEQGARSAVFLAERGDVLFWHPRLVHRGSMPRDPSLTRKALIAHYSGIHHRPDMPVERRRPQGLGWYYVPPSAVPVR